VGGVFYAGRANFLLDRIASLIDLGNANSGSMPGRDTAPGFCLQGGQNRPGFPLGQGAPPDFAHAETPRRALPTLPCSDPEVRPIDHSIVIINECGAALTQSVPSGGAPCIFSVLYRADCAEWCAQPQDNFSRTNPNTSGLSLAGLDA
jgi:hypothetical protein